MVSLAHREKVKPLGIHTVLGHAHAKNIWDTLPHLKDNGGMLPPFVIAVGSRTRVWDAGEILNLRNFCVLDEDIRVRLGAFHGNRIAGRVAVAIGTYDYQGFEFPLAVVETQMGCSATQINLKEALYFTRDDGYQFGDKEIRSNAIYVVRAGTCAGVNSHNPAEDKVEIGDIFIATESYGSIGALIQSFGGSINFSGPNIAHVLEVLRGRDRSLRRALTMSSDDNSLVTHSSDLLNLRLQRAADSLKLRNFTGKNFSKDSLYAELGEDGFAMLRDTFGVISTEMEQLMVDALAAEFSDAGIRVHSGLVSAAIGAIPGKSFPETVEDHRLAEAAEKNILLVAADAFGAIAKSLNP